MCGITASIACSTATGLPCSANGHNANGHNADGTVNNLNRAEDNTRGTLADNIRASIALLNHRGPDESGVWISPDESIALGHCRLTINDLTPSGRQPLTSDDGHIHAVVNGEIYDFDRLRQICTTEHGYEFQGQSDSELVIALYKIHGAPGMFEHLRGEFAFVLYDGRDGCKRVIAGRDRFGIKPLVWTRVGGRLLLAAEAKAFLPLGWKPEWDIKALADSSWQLDDGTLFKGVKKLRPGHWMEINDKGIECHRYWDAEYRDKKTLETRSADEMILEVRKRIFDAVRLRLRADVPVGIYLSGGIDSSALAGIVMQLVKEENIKIGSESSSKVTCFTVGFPKESGYDESSVAERTAKWLGVDLIQRELNEEILAAGFEDTAYHCEQHHFDMNCIGKFALSSLPREHGIKVVLTGEGADEHFAGYPQLPIELLREADYSQPESLLSREPELRRGLHDAVEKQIRGSFKSVGASIDTNVLPELPELADINCSVAPDVLAVWHSKPALYMPWMQEKMSHMDYRVTFLNAFSQELKAKMKSQWHPLHSALYMWNQSGLPNVLLSCLADRVEMAHGIEARTPFLDHHLTEYVNGLPPSVKIAPNEMLLDQHQQGSKGSGGGGPNYGVQGFTDKWILREAVKPYIPEELYKRQKLPFMAPTRWSSDGPLRQLFEKLLTREAVEQLGFVRYDTVQDAMGQGFGKEAQPAALRILLNVGAWVTLSKRLGVKTVHSSDWD